MGGVTFTYPRGFIVIPVAVALIVFQLSSQAQEAKQFTGSTQGPTNDSGHSTFPGKPQVQHITPPSPRWVRPLTPLRIASTYVVTTTANGGAGSLRAAIDSANRLPDLTAITFNIGAGIHTITPSPALPVCNYPVIIDGSVQGVPMIELNGTSAGLDADGLVLRGGNSIVRGLIINRFRTGIGFGLVLDVNGGNVIEGNYIGLNATGTAASPNSGLGLAIKGTSGGNIIGGITPEARNVISGNGSSGIGTELGNPGGNVFRGNYIGTNAAGTAVVPNQGNGIYIQSPNDTVGGLTPGARNIISGNVNPDIFIQTTAIRTIVQGNYIGTDVTGNVDISGATNGINIRSSNNIIGDASELGRNVVSGHDFPSIYILGAAASGNRVLGNFIGTNAAGTDSLGDGQGIVIDGAPNSIIGGSTYAERNVISGHSRSGLVIRNAGATGNKVVGNFIGTDESGTAALGNTDGIFIDNAPRNIIGGAPGEGNLIAGNSLSGIEIRNAGISGNKIINNIIGNLDDPSLGNGLHGVAIASSQDTLKFNSIAFNGGSGVYDSAGTQNLITQNSIFSNAGRGIDLAPAGLAINDSLDNDTGPNNLQNFPILDSARIEGDHFIVHVRINSKPNSLVNIDFYTNDAYDDSHFGEGQYWATQVQVPTDAGGNCKFWTAVPIYTGLDNYITATATDQQGNTSEFSQALCTLDSDGDGILDSWETHGWGIDVNSDGIIDLDLDTLGARTNHRDIFVEVDAMAGMAPQPTTLPYVVRSFANSKNGGINLHITNSDSTITPVPWLFDWWTSFAAVKRAYFGTREERASPNARFILEAKRLVYRYCVFAYQHTTGNWSGRAEDNFAQGCDDFMVTMGPWPTSGGTEAQKAGTFMHELGHTLGLRHGGGDQKNLKTNYISVMNYTWQSPHMEWMNKWPLDYSPEALPTLIEAGLDEWAGLGVPTGSQFAFAFNVPYSGPQGGVMSTKLKPGERVDWDSSGVFDVGLVVADLNAFTGAGSSPGDTLVSQDDWSKLIYNFRNSPDFSTAPRSALLPLSDELDLETWQLIDNFPPPKPKGVFVMDGQLDTSAFLVATNAGINLYARYKSGQLYVATNSAQSQSADMFIFISDARNPLRGAPLGKAGQVAAWTAFLSNKSSDNSSEWYSTPEWYATPGGVVTSEAPLTNITADSAGAVLEGVVDIELLYGNTPANLFIAVGKYGTNSGGTLLTQVPVGNGDGNIDPSELFWFTGAPPPPNTYLTQQGRKLVGSGAVQGSYGSYQGNAVALSADGNTAIVGGYFDNDGFGAAWIFTRSAGVWNQQGGKLLGIGGVGGFLLQGYSVALSGDGNTAIVGGPFDNHNIGGSQNAGSAWVFTRSGNSWSQQGPRLFDPNARGIQNVSQGSAVALSADGNTAVVGGKTDSTDIGAAWVYTRNGNIWSRQGGKLVGTGSTGNVAYQGTSISLSADGNTALVGGPGDGNGVGAAWVFTRTGALWNQQGGKLVGSGAVGAASQGSSVSLSSDGNTAIVGGFQDNNHVGASWVFKRAGGVWTQQGSKLVGSDAVGASWQGSSVSLSSDGNVAIVGGLSDAGSVGAAWIYTRNGDVWTQRGDKLLGTGAVGIAEQGYAVSLSSDGNTAIIGGIGDSSHTGAAWVFVRDTPLPIQLASFTVRSNPNGNGVLLDWVTISEINNYGFEIQRSPGNENNYSTLSNSFIPGHGTTNEPQHYTFIDVTAMPARWYYRLRQIDLDGTVHYSDGIAINTLTGVSGSQLPDKFGLSQNYPDPFNPSTTIQYQLPRAAHVTLKIYNLLGQEVVTLVDGVEAPGYKSAVWNAANVASGVYFYRIMASFGQTTFADVRKMLVLK